MTAVNDTIPKLFRSSRPDYIETGVFPICIKELPKSIVPVFQAGLH